MTETQSILSETPNQVSVDLLSDLLGSMHLSGAVLFSAVFREPWGLAAPAGCELSCMLPFRTEYIIPFHIIAEGGCWLELKERTRVWLEAGDAVLLPYGDSHGLCGREEAVKVPGRPVGASTALARRPSGRTRWRRRTHPRYLRLPAMR